MIRTTTGVTTSAAIAVGVSPREERYAAVVVLVFFSSAGGLGIS